MRIQTNRIKNKIRVFVAIYLSSTDCTDFILNHLRRFLWLIEVLCSAFLPRMHEFYLIRYLL